jgi:extracellular factor (EF) 3-hydroxypalmitic acid methyl ester biosynthesis protein
LDSKTSAFETAFNIFGNKAIDTIKEFAHGIDASLNKITDKEIRKTHSDFFRKNLGEYFISATFTGRAFHKPRGYAGDYEMMNQIYRNSPEGDSLFQKIVHMYGINETSSISVRLRKDYLKKKITSLLSLEGKIVVGSLACGPGREVIELLSELDQSEIVRFTFVLMDQDHHALLNAQRNILKVIRDRNLDCEVHLLPLSVKQILEHSEESKALDQLKFDLLYTAGLYDYLPQKVAKNLTTIISQTVKDTGELIIGNFHPDNPTKTISDLVADWRLIHRNHDEMRDLVSNTQFKKIDFYLDEVKVDLFLIAKK